MMMDKVKVTRNYQVTIPAALRQKVGIKVGSILMANVEGDRIILEKKSGDITKLKLRLGRKFGWRDVEAAAREAGEKTGR
jgi:AbrB family looped-hinge helix DNA binding protein